MRSLDHLEKSTFVSVGQIANTTQTSLIEPTVSNLEGKTEPLFDSEEPSFNEVLIHKWGNKEKVTPKPLF